MKKQRLMRGIAALALTAFLWAGSGNAAQAAPPANDDFASAQVIGPALPVAAPGTNVEATAQAGEPAVAGNPAISTVWFRWTAPSAGTRVIDLCEDNFSGPADAFRTVEAYTGATLGTLVSVGEGSTGDCLIRFNAILGQEYRFQVDYRNAPGTFIFRLRQLGPPVNDSFVNATEVGPGLPVSLSASNVDSTWQASEPANLGNSGSSRSVWFRWTAPANGQVRVSACDFTTVSGAANLTLGIYTGATLPSLSAVVAASGNCEQTFVASAGTIYRIAFSGSVRGEGNFTLNIRDAPPPPNDDFANAQDVGPGLNLFAFGNNEFASAEPGEPAHTGPGFPAARSVWFKWTPIRAERVAVRACNREFGARVAVYTGNALNSLTGVGEVPGYAPHCRVLLNAVIGTTYFIAVGGGPQDGAFGDFVLQVRRESRPANDNFASAKRLIIKAPGRINGTTVDATTEPGEDAHDPDGSSAASGSVWYRWTAQRSRPLTLFACSPSEPMAIAAYTGNATAGLTRVASSATGCKTGKGGRITIPQVRGTAYRVAVAALDRDFPRSFTLSSRVSTRKFILGKQIKRCRKIDGKTKRQRCIRKARKTKAMLKCQVRLDAAAQTRCVKAARKRF
jgi:hypothetical protein